MAQRFAIDGNFTQSIVGTINLNADECPSDFVNRPFLHYDVASGDVCYRYDDRVCFDYYFNATKILGPSDPGIPGWGANENILAYSDPGFITFVQSQSFVVGSINYRPPSSFVDDTVYLLINTQSYAGTALYGYLTQNEGSGSITLTSLNNTVEFRYNTQLLSTPYPNYTNGDVAYGNQIAIGASSIVATPSNNSLTTVVATSNQPFIQDERICVEVSPIADVYPLQEVMEVGSSTTIAISSSAAVALSGSGNLIINDIIAGDILSSGAITASVVSSSNQLFASVSLSDGVNNVVVVDTGSGQFFYTSSAAFEAVLSQDLTSVLNDSVGGVDNGETFVTGTSLETVLRDILIEYISSTLTFNQSGGRGIYSGSTQVSIPSYSEVSSSIMFDVYKWDITTDSDGLVPTNGFVSMANSSLDNHSFSVVHTNGSNIKSLTGSGFPNGAIARVNPATIAGDQLRTVTFFVKGDNTEGTSLTDQISTSFLYPMYYGASNIDFSAATGSEFELFSSNFTKTLTPKTNKQFTLNANVEFIYLAYRNSYSDLVTIFDGNDFNVTSDFTKTVANLKSSTLNWGSDAHGDISYNIYKSNTVTTQTNQSYKFNFT